jgi:hypothetical protein
VLTNTSAGIASVRAAWIRPREAGPTPPRREAPNGERGGARSASEFRVPGPSATRPIWRRPSLPFSATFEISRRIGLGGPNGGRERIP